MVVRKPLLVHGFRPPRVTSLPGQQVRLTSKSKKPGRTARAFFGTSGNQAAGLNSFDALALIGSTVSVATFWVNSASSLLWAVNASN